MTRTAARELAIQLSFAASASGQDVETLLDEYFSADHFATISEVPELEDDRPDEKQMLYIRRLVGLASEKRETVDAYIERYAKGWKPERISRTALAILRCAICEILYMEDIPNAAAINEAVELDKAYDDPETVSFVNGVLGGFIRGEFGEASAHQE